MVNGTMAVTNSGAGGGTITNCAHLTGTSSTVNSGGFNLPVVNGIDLEACATQTIGSTTCTPGTAGCGSATYGVSELSPVTDDLNLSFGFGNVSLFAQDHLVNGPCP